MKRTGPDTKMPYPTHWDKEAIYQYEERLGIMSDGSEVTPRMIQVATEQAERYLNERIDTNQNKFTP